MVRSISPQEKKSWESWLNDQNDEAANDLIKQYEHIVNYHTQRIAIHLPHSVSKEDIRSLGLMGLYDAMKKFDHTRNLKFETYASFRVRGAMLDGLRKEDRLSRTVREKAKKIEQVSQEFEQRHYRIPTSAEIGKQLNMTEKEVEDVMKDALFSNVLSIEDGSQHTRSDHKEGADYPESDEHRAPDQWLIMKENYDELAEGIEKLNKNEQIVISLFYNEELTFTEIGKVLGLTTSRISQIHRKAIFHLKKYLSSFFK